MRTPLIVANWKMQMLPGDAEQFAEDLRTRLAGFRDREVVILPSFTSVQGVGAVLEGTSLKIGAQNAHWKDRGPFTGEVSAPMLKALSCSYVLVGHSERRRHFGETDELVAAKLRAVLSSEMSPILCVGETEAERSNGLTGTVIERQVLGSLKGLAKSAIAQVVVAYEPVWAIGTGKTATPDEAQEVQANIRRLIARCSDERIAKQTRILYGGSVKPENARDLLCKEDIDGVLVGDSSLSVDAFESIIRS